MTRAQFANNMRGIDVSVAASERTSALSACDEGERSRERRRGRCRRDPKSPASFAAACHSPLPSPSLLFLPSFLTPLTHPGPQGGRDVDPRILAALYDDIARTPLAADLAGADFGITFHAPARRGWLLKRCSGGVVRWKRRYFLLADGCLYYFLSELDAEGGGGGAVAPGAAAAPGGARAQAQAQARAGDAASSAAGRPPTRVPARAGAQAGAAAGGAGAPQPRCILPLDNAGALPSANASARTRRARERVINTLGARALTYPPTLPSPPLAPLHPSLAAVEAFGATSLRIVAVANAGAAAGSAWPAASPPQSDGARPSLASAPAPSQAAPVLRSAKRLQNGALARGAHASFELRCGACRAPTLEQASLHARGRTRARTHARFRATHRPLAPSRSEQC